MLLTLISDNIGCTDLLDGADVLEATLPLLRSGVIGREHVWILIVNRLLAWVHGVQVAAHVLLIVHLLH